MNFDILFPLRFILAVLVIFILGIILEAMRDFILQKPFMKFVSNKYGDKLKRIDNWFNTF